MDRATLPPVPAVISISGLTKTYASGFEALKGIDLDIRRRPVEHGLQFASVERPVAIGVPGAEPVGGHVQFLGVELRNATLAVTGVGVSLTLTAASGSR